MKPKVDAKVSNPNTNQTFKVYLEFYFKTWLQKPGGNWAYTIWTQEKTRTSEQKYG